MNIPVLSGLIELGTVFTLLFVMLGPLKIIGPFSKLTHGVPDAEVRNIALRTFGIALVAVLAGAFGGRELLEPWNVPPAALLLTGGIIFFLVGLRVVLEQYQPAPSETAELPSKPMAAAMRITFPTVVTPYGTATVIVFLANAYTVQRILGIVALVVGVMVINLFAMLYARRLMANMATTLVLAILGAVLGVMQVAMAVTLMFRALIDLGVLHG